MNRKAEAGLSAPEAARMSVRGWVLFVSLCILWGTPFLFIKIADRYINPSVLAFGRVTLAAIVLVPLVVRTSSFAPLRRKVPLLLVVAAVEVAIPIQLTVYSERWITSSLAGILLTTQPVFVAVFALGMDFDERATPARLLGMLVAMAGVVCLVGLGSGGGQHVLVGVAAALGASGAYALGSLLLKRWFSDVVPMVAATGAVGLAVLLLLPTALLSIPLTVPRTSALVSLGVLGLIAAGTFPCFFALIAEVGATRGSVPAFVVPGVALILGVTFLGEPVGVASMVGLVLVVAGSWMTLGRGTTANREECGQVCGL